MLIEACRDGEPPSPALARESLAGWSGERLAQALAGIRAARTPRRRSRAGGAHRRRMLAFAAVVHAELAFRHLDARGRPRRRPTSRWARACSLCCPRRRRRPRCGRAGSWAWAAATAVTSSWTGARWFREGLGPRPDDGRLLLALGSVDEWMADYRNPVCPSAAECPSSATREQYLAVEWERQRL